MTSIGEAATALCGATSTVLVYAEVDEDVISADLHFQPEGEDVVHFRFAPESLRDLIYEFWELGSDAVAPKSWAVLRFIVSAGKFTADLAYPDKLNPDEGVPERRSIVVRECFAGLKVDYSRPRGEAALTG